jgi:hypothetical protein
VPAEGMQCSLAGRGLCGMPVHMGSVKRQRVDCVYAVQPVELRVSTSSADCRACSSSAAVGCPSLLH